MRIAIATFGTSVSPRFDYAPEVLVVNIESGRELGRGRIAMGGVYPATRLRRLKDEGVSVLICGNIDVFSEQMAESLGIRLVPWVTGEVEDAIRLFLMGDLAPGTILSPSGPQGQWGLGRGRGRRRRGRWFEEFNNLQEVSKMPRGDGTGPAGKGPGTGRGLGPCGGGGAGRGGGQGGGRGTGRGSGMGRGGGRGGGQGGPA